MASNINNVLKKFPEYWEEENLIKHKVVSDLRDYKLDLIESLLDDNLISKTYSIKTSKGNIFKVEELIDMLRFKTYWKNSYTKYSTKIGLATNGKYLDYNTDVVLDFPYKDSVLEGGMSSEDHGKKEVYYHKILAKEEIDLLFSEKVLTNVKKYTKDGVAAVNSFNEDEDNLIIKGNNLIALHSLKKRYAGKVKLIYIDPPFNTGGDGFKYNDRFNHSTWLTFMKNRLEIAKDLLSEDGTIYVHLDYNEVHYCKVLMDEIFGRQNFLNEVIWGYRERETSKRFYNKKHDTILFYAKNASSNYVFNYDEIREEYSSVTLSKFKYTDENGEKYRLRTRDGKSDPAVEDENTYRQYLDAQSGPLPRDWFVMPFLNQSSQERIGFNTQKPEILLEKFIKASTNEGDIILDFFSGSGTTIATAHKLNRRYVGIEQMDYINDYLVPRLQNVVNGEQTGISQKVNWHGGGSFIYAELLELNHSFASRIQKTKSSEELEAITTDMMESAFFDYKVNLDNITSEDEDFRNLSFDEKKRILTESLDANQIYLSYSEIDDAVYEIPESLKQFNHAFYKTSNPRGKEL